MIHDVLIVLGYDNNKEDPVFRARVEKTAALYHAGYAPQIIMAGCCSVKLDIQPSTTEAAAMRDYAIELDIPASAILLEEDSVDTLGNFYFSKTRFLLPCSWYHVGFVSTPWHVWRSNWLAEKVLGPEFEITGYPTEIPNGWDESEQTRSQQHNEALLAFARSELDQVQDGDHGSIEPYLGVKPPATPR